RAEWFCNIVECPESEADVFGVGRSPSRNKDHGSGGGPRVTPKNLAHAESIQIWQHEVQENEIWRKGFHQSNGVQAIVGGFYLVPRPSQMKAYQFGESDFVIHREDFCSCRKHAAMMQAPGDKWVCK